MMPWNRKEIWIGNDPQKFSKAKTLLGSNQVEYDCDAKTSWSAGRGGMVNGNAGIATRYGEAAGTQQFHIYVHRYDYEKARILLRNV